MTSTLDPEYSKMLSAPAPLEGPRKNAIESLQNQIDFYIGEVGRLRRIQNSHVVISQLPLELLSDVFLYVVEAGLRNEDTNFVTGTFAFLQVCKRWNEVAVGSPQLWVWWIPGTLKAWDLFRSRSKDVPLFLTWRHCSPGPVPNVLADTATRRRIRQLDFSGTHEQLEQILGTLDSRSTSTTSSVRLRCPFYEKNDNADHLTRFFSLSFPKLSKLDINTFPPDPTSPVLTTSNLTSLKLDITYNNDRRYTQSQFLQALQQHPNLKQLHLRAGGFPSVENSRGLVPVVLPHLVDLRLYGTDEVIDGFIDLVSMSSPLHNVIIDFERNGAPGVVAHENTAKKILTVYYGCKELEYPRKATHLTISSPPPCHLIIGAKSHSTSAYRPIYNLELRFHGMRGALVQEIIPFFPLKHVRKYATERFDPPADDWRGTLRRMKNLLHLRLDNMDIVSVLIALDLINEVKPDQPIVPKLKSLSLLNVYLLEQQHNGLLDVLKARRAHDIGLKSLVVRSCHVHTLEYEKELKGLVKKVTWEDVTEMDSEYVETETEEETDSEDEYHGFDYWMF